jgi:hypothetical protein
MNTIRSDLILQDRTHGPNAHAAYWKPKTDITAMELAIGLPLLIYAGTNAVQRKAYDALPASVRRHFELVT